MLSVEQIAGNLKEHQSRISPGQSFHLTEAHSVNDCVWQGDLGLIVVNEVPNDYKLVEKPIEQDRQLVPLDGSPGSHHRLKSFNGVRLYRPKDWGESEIDLRGPCVVFEKPNAIVHESGTENPHGTVFIDVPMIIRCSYQRNLNMLEAFSHRARD